MNKISGIRKINMGTFPDLENIGNIKNYDHKIRAADTHGFLITPNLTLKLYSMHEGSTMKNGQIKDSKLLLEDEISKGNITPLSGMGFSILSKDMLNVSRWDLEYPIILKNQIYSFEYGFSNIKKLDLENAGPFCIWEEKIMNHERDAWIKYLKSDKKEQDKLKYLNRFIIGNLE